MLPNLVNTYCQLTSSIRIFDGIPLLLLRLYLAPIMLQAGWQKWQYFEQTTDWFGNPEYGLGLPFPELLAALATGAELGGGILILIGLATRLASIPLAITMLVAMVTVHGENGWLAIADASSWFANGVLFTDTSVMAAPDKLQAANQILTEHGYIDWLTSSGQFVILNNGIEFAATYFIMLLVLLVYGGGRGVSVDYIINRKLNSIQR